MRSIKLIPRPIERALELNVPRVLGQVVDQKKKVQVVGEVYADDDAGKKMTFHLTKVVRPNPAPSGPVYYSPLGMTLMGRRLLSDYCVINPNITEAKMGLKALAAYGKHAPVLKQGTIFGMHCPTTFGDWFRNGLLTLCTYPIRPPLIVQKRWVWERGYVRRDIERLGLDVYLTGDQGVTVQEPLLLTQVGGNQTWLPGEVDRIRRAMRVTPMPPRPGSLLYLSREGEPGIAIKRKYPNSMVERVIRELGGRVVRVKDTSFEDYLTMGIDAETVVADHGSAQCNMAWWKPRTMVEIVTTWWNPYFVTQAKSIGVEKYTCLFCKGKTEAQIESALRRILAANGTHSPTFPG